MLIPIPLPLLIPIPLPILIPIPLPILILIPILIEKIKTSKKLDHLCEIIKRAFRMPKVRVHDPRHYIFETAFVLLLSMNTEKVILILI